MWKLVAVSATLLVLGPSAVSHRMAAAMGDRMSAPAPNSFVTTQLTDMTRPSSPLFDLYLAGRLGGRTIGDLRIVETLDPTLQRAASQMVTEGVKSLTPEHVTDGALVSIDLRDGCYGCILAHLGTAGVDRFTAGIDMADRPRQAGSIFITFDYLRGFEKGLSPGTTVRDAPFRVPDRGGYFSPANYDRTFHGRIDLRTALGNSYNIPAARIGIWTTPGAVAGTAYSLGVSDLWRDNPHCCTYAATLGGLERGVRLKQATAAYGALATNGVGVFPISFKEIADRTTGKVLWRASQDPFLKRQRHRVAPATAAYMVTSVLSDNAARAHDFGSASPLLLSRPSAAKSGSTNGFTDYWTVGYTPQLVTGVWVGNADNSAMVGTTGISGAAPIWHRFMENAFTDLKLQPKAFSIPANVKLGRRCTLPGTTRGIYGSFPTGPDLYPVGTTPFCSVPNLVGAHKS